MFGALSSDVLSVPRVFFRASADRVLPIKALSKVHPKFATPYIAVICYASMDFIFASVGGFQQLAIISSASILLVYLGVSMSVIKLRRKHPTTSKDDIFKIPGGYLVPILSAAIIIWLLSNLTKTQAIAIVIFVAALSLIYFLKTKFMKDH